MLYCNIDAFTHTIQENQSNIHNEQPYKSPGKKCNTLNITTFPPYKWTECGR